MVLVQTEPKAIKIGSTAVKKVMLGSTQIRPVIPGWQPGANTLLYMPLNSTDTYTDQSGNNRTTTNTNVSFGTYQGVDCGYLNGTSAYIQITPFAFSSELSLLIWLYPAGYTSGYDGKIFDARRNSYAFTSRYGTFSGDTGITGYINGTVTLIGNEANKRMLFVMTSKNGSQTYKLLGNNIDITKTSSLSFSSFTPSQINLGNEYNNGAGRYYKGGMSELILEDKVRTAQEISDYYNQTKGIYGL